MEKWSRGDIPARFMQGAACAFSLSAIAGVYTQQTRPPGQQQPALPYWHVRTDENGASCQDRCELSGFKYDDFSLGTAPMWVDRMDVPAKSVVIIQLPSGWVGEWHENPEPQWIVPLAGRWFVETMDGKRVEMGPGEISFGNDQNTKADAKGRRGHLSGTVGDQPCTLMLVQMDRNAANTPPCRTR